MPSLIESIDNITKIFKKYASKDCGHDKLNKAEFAQLIKDEFSQAIKNSDDAETASRMMKALDENDDGELDFNEFVVLLCKVTKAYNQHLSKDKGLGSCDAAQTGGPARKLDPVPDTKAGPVKETKPSTVLEAKPSTVPGTKLEPVKETKPNSVSESKSTPGPAPVKETKQAPAPETKPAEVKETKREPVPATKPAPQPDSTYKASPDTKSTSVPGTFSKPAQPTGEPSKDAPKQTGGDAVTWASKKGN